MSQKLIIGLHGKRRVGKDTAADYLVREHGFTKIAFADKLREECAELSDQPDLFFKDYEQYKDTDHPDLAIIFMSLCTKWKFIAKGFAVYCSHKFKNFDEVAPRSPRWWLQNYSDFVKQKYGADVWINKWISKVAMCDTSIVVPDIRYDNEASHVRAQPGFLGIVEIFRKGVDNDPTHNHNSDNRLSQQLVDDWIVNATNIAVYESCIKLSLEDLIEKFNRKQAFIKGG